MNERRSNWKKFQSKAELARNKKILDLMSERSQIQREMAATPLLSARYAELQRQLRENAARIITA